MSTLNSPDKILLGTSLWLSKRMGLEVQLVRILFIVFVLLGGSGFLLYLLIWLVSQVAGK